MAAGVAATLAFGVGAAGPAQASDLGAAAPSASVQAVSPKVSIEGKTWIGQTISTKLLNSAGYEAEYRWYKVDADGTQSRIAFRGHGPTLLLDGSDVDYRVKVNVIFRKAGSPNIGVWSELSAVVTEIETEPVAPAPVGYAAMKGTTIQGETIEAFAKAPAGYVASQYRWYRVDSKGTQSFVNHTGNAKVLKVGKLEVGKKVKVNVIFTKAGAKNVSAWSSLSSTIEAAPKVAMFGKTKVGQTIKTRVKAPKGYAVKKSSWYRVTSKGKQQAIAGFSNKPTLKLSKAEIGTKVKVRVTFVKKGVKSLTAWSTLSSKVAK